MLPSVAVRTMAGVVSHMVVTSGPSVARSTVAHVDTELAIRAGVTVEKEK